MSDALPCLDLLPATPAVQLHLALCRNAGFDETFGRFEGEPAATVGPLRALPAEAGRREARHLSAGIISLSKRFQERALRDIDAGT